jgi:hypothetical protein
MTDFEDPTSLVRCIKSDCQAYRAGNTPFCAEHLREQETKSAGIVEPEVEERARAAGDRAMGEETYAGPDPDTHGLFAVADAVVRESAGNVPPAPKFDPDVLEPHWDGTQWVLRPRPADPFAGYPQKMARIGSLVRELMAELDIYEADDA